MRSNVLILIFTISFLIENGANAVTCPPTEATQLCSSVFSGAVSAANGLAPTALTSFRYNPSGTGSFTVDIFNNLRTFTHDDCTNIPPSTDTNLNTFYVQLVCGTNSGPAIIGNLQIQQESSTGAILPPSSSVTIASRQTVTNLLVAPNAGQYIGNAFCTLNLLADFYAQDPCTQTCVTCSAKLIASQQVATGPSSSGCMWLDLACYDANNQLAYSSFFYILLMIGMFFIGLGIFVVLILQHRDGPMVRISHEVVNGKDTSAALAMLNGTFQAYDASSGAPVSFMTSGAAKRKRSGRKVYREVIDEPSDEDEKPMTSSSSSSSSSGPSPAQIIIPAAAPGQSITPMAYALGGSRRY